MTCNKGPGTALHAHQRQRDCFCLRPFPKLHTQMRELYRQPGHGISERQRQLIAERHHAPCRHGTTAFTDVYVDPLPGGMQLQT